MKIYLPKAFKDTNLTEGQKLLVAWLLMCCEEEGFDHYYIMNSYDVKYMFGRGQGMLNLQSDKMDAVRELVELVELDEFNWAFKFRVTKTGWFKRRYKGARHPQPIATIPVILKDITAIKTWCYLMGRWTRGEVIVDTNDILPYKEGAFTRTNLHRDNTQIK
jgi:hypothetical protein